MENKKLLNVDLESTDYDPAQVGNLDRRLEVGKKDAVFFHVCLLYTSDAADE